MKYEVVSVLYILYLILYFSSTQYQSISIIHNVIQVGESDGVDKMRVLIMNCEKPATIAKALLGNRNCCAQGRCQEHLSKHILSRTVLRLSRCTILTASSVSLKFCPHESRKMTSPSVYLISLVPSSGTG
jgi:hypothetical protein